MSIGDERRPYSTHITQRLDEISVLQVIYGLQ